MKRNLLLLTVISILFFTRIASAQTLVFHEDFEVIDSMTTSGNAVWFQQAGFYTSATHCMRDTVAIADSSYLTSIAFSTTGNNSVILYFNHICKISFADQGTVEVSNNNGASWVQLTVAQYLGSSGFGVNSNRFSSAVYGPTSTGWHPNVDTMTPTNTWWKAESFNISSLIPNATQAKIRFKLKDGNNNGSGRNYGWLIDDVNVIAAPHELVSPHIAWSPPYFQGNIFFNPGPYTISDTLFDLPTTGGCGLDTSSAANLFYTINNGAPISLHMVNTSGNIFRAVIPAVSSGDTVCYYVQAHDTCSNSVLLPSSGCISFIALNVIVFPFLDNFDFATNLWTPTDSSTGSLGSDWQLGTPAFGLTNSTHSGSKAWDIDTASGYTDQANCMLYSPYFDFTNVYNPVLSFWRNHRVEQGWDGVRLEYSVDSGATWNILGGFNDPKGTNWYTTAHINSSNTVAWDNATTGWIKSSYKLGCLFGGNNHVRFRFIFTSDFSVTQDGFSIDDFAIDVPPANDIGVISILKPAVAALSGISDSVKIVIGNFGSQAVTVFNISYSINGGTSVTQPYSGTLQPCDVDTILFTTPFTVPAGAFNICAYTALAGDSDQSNDTICKNSQGITLITIPYIEDFDSLPALWYDSSAFGTNWQLGIPNFGTTNSTHSGNKAWDINLTTGYNNSAHSILTSPLFDFTGIYNAKLSFWQNRNTENVWDGTRVEYSTNYGASWQVLGVQFDPLGINWYNNASINSSSLPAWDSISIDPATGLPGWIKSTYTLVPLNNVGAGAMLRFIFTSDFSVPGVGFTIDDLKIMPPSPLDASVIKIVQPGLHSPAGISNPVKAIISNEGLNSISNFNVSYTVNSVLTGTFTYTGTLLPSVHDTVTLPSFIIPTGAFDICAYTSLSGDGDHSNDTTCESSFGIPVMTLPYVDHFDTGAVVWNDSSAAGTHWQLGMPNFGSTNSAHSGTKAWDINLNSTYGDNANSILTSPLFNFTSQVNAKLSFWMNRNIDPTGDGVFMEYSINGGTTWQRLGIVGDANAFGNWYNNANLDFTGLPAWDGSSAGWVKYSYILGPPFNNAGAGVQFRFVFTSNFFTTTDGISIDDFSIIPASPVDLGVLSINQPVALIAAGTNATVNVTFRNFGTTTVTNPNLAYRLNGSLIATETWTGSLAPSATTAYAFTTHFTVPTGPFNICAYTSLGADGDHQNDTICKNCSGFNAHDVGVSAILKPAPFGILGATDSVKVVISNFGTQTTSNFPVRFRINSGSVFTGNFTGAILPGASVTFTFNTSFIIPNGSYTICAWTAASNDTYLYNDTLCKTSYGLHTIFHEDFEVVDSMTTSGTAPWFQENAYHSNGTYCMRDTVSANGTAYLTSIPFSTTGFNFVALYFDQICKINFADRGYLEVSADNGASWATLTGSSYWGASTFFPTFNYFSSFSYDSTWDAIHDLALPQNNWWKTEVFDISSIAANSSQVQFRFRLSDGNGNGSTGNYGWLVDHIEVAAAASSPVNLSPVENHSNSLSIYPNPTSGIFYLKKDDWMKTNSLIVVRDILGNEILKVTSFKTELLPLDLSLQPNGIYFVSVISTAGTANQRVILCK